MSEFDIEDDLDIPDGAVITGRVEIISYLDPDDLETTIASSMSEGLELGKLLEMLEWCKAVALAPMNAHCVAQYVECCDDEDDDY